MLRIGICITREIFKKYVEDLFGSLLYQYGEWSMEMIPVSAFLEQSWKTFPNFHIFCLDEQILKQTGMNPVAYISRISPETSILLLEGQEEQGLGGVRYHLYTYQMKRMQQRDFEMEISRRWQQANSKPRQLSIEKDGMRISVPIEDVIYIESNNHQITLHTTQGDYEYYEKMYVLEELLREDCFIRCHQSYIVSKRFVTDYDSSGIQIEQMVLPVGRKYKEQVDLALGGREPRECGLEKPASEKQGVLIGVRGAYEGVKLHFRPEQRILLGRDRKTADIVINLPLVSRVHCIIVYHEKDNRYELVDFSKNGTYISERKRLVPDMTYCVSPGTQIRFGDTEQLFCLG